MSCSLSEEVPPHMRPYGEEMGIKFVPITTIIDIPKRCEITEEERENNRKLRQADLACSLKIRTAKRLLGEDQSVKKIRSPVGEYIEKCQALLKQNSLYPHKHENHWVAQLPNVLLMCSNGEKIANTLEGTLEAACGSGFTFTGPGIHVHFKDTSVALCFYYKDESAFSLADPDRELKLPGLQFHLRDPVKVGTVETKDIMFVPVRYLEDHVKDLDKFVKIVDRAPWDSHRMLPEFQVLMSNSTFQGVVSGSLEKFALTYCALVLLVQFPCTVVLLDDIEIIDLSVNVGIDMTVVFKDFERKVLQINSIDLRKLNFIKGCLDRGSVKYYCRDYPNGPKVDWDSKLKEILNDPNKFVESGGWESLNLEDPTTLSYYGIESDDEEDESWAGFFQ